MKSVSGWWDEEEIFKNRGKSWWDFYYMNVSHFTGSTSYPNTHIHVPEHIEVYVYRL